MQRDAPLHSGQEALTPPLTPDVEKGRPLAARATNAPKAPEREVRLSEGMNIRNKCGLRD